MFYVYVTAIDWIECRLELDDECVDYLIDSASLIELPADPDWRATLDREILKHRTSDVNLRYIKREENMKTKNNQNTPHPLIICFILPKNIFSNLKNCKTHKGYTTHELTCVVSSCVLYPLCVLYFLLKILEIT